MFVTFFVLLDIILRPTAYLDPGSGSFIIQILFGAIVGILVVLKAYWSKIRAFFNKESEQSDTAQEENGRSHDS